MTFFHDKDIKTEVVDEGKVTRKIRGYNNQLMAVEVFFENGGIGTVHKHVHDQVTYVLEGSFEFTVEDEVSVVNQGDSIVINSNIEHGARVLSDKGRLLDMFSPMREDFL